MATITRYVNPDSTAGGDGTTNATTGANRAYVSLSAWEAATQQDLTDAGGDIAECICETGGTADTVAVTIDGWSTNASSYIDIKTSAGHRHAGVWSAAKYNLSPSGIGITNLEADVKITGLQIGSTANHGIAHNASLALNFNIANCIIRGNTSATKYGLWMFGVGAGSVNKIWNTIIYDYSGASAAAIRNADADSTVYAYNNTISGCTAGIDNNAGTMTAVNNIVTGSGDTNAYIGTFTSSNYNATNGTDTGDGGANSLQSATLTFVDAAGKNFHLASDSDAVDAGTPDPGSGLFSDDIDGETRSGTWDIGADEYVAAGGGAPWSMVGRSRLVNAGITGGLSRSSLANHGGH